LRHKFNVYGSVRRNNILVYKSQQDAHVTEFILSDNCSTCSGVTITHLQEHKITLTTASDNRYTVWLSTAIVEELEPVSISYKMKELGTMNKRYDSSNGCK
jgi:hypothetical protein